MGDNPPRCAPISVSQLQVRQQVVQVVDTAQLLNLSQNVPSSNRNDVGWSCMCFAGAMRKASKGSCLFEFAVPRVRAASRKWAASILATLGWFAPFMRDARSM